MTRLNLPPAFSRGYGLRWRGFGLGMLVAILMVSALIGPGAHSASAHAQGISATTTATATPTATATATASPTATATATASPTPTAGDPVIAAAGDIACDPVDSAYKDGNGTKYRCQEKWTAAELSGVTAVLPLGDNQYDCATLSAFQQSYDPTWGLQKAIEYPVVGNHEYATNCTGASAGAAGYFTYFGAAATPLQPSCTAKCKGYYSFDLGTWHIIALNSECNQVGGCAAGSAQEKWLKADLAAHPNTCTLAYWHRPYFSSGQSAGDTLLHDIWVDLYSAHVDVVLNGHDHNYQRYAPQDPDGNATPNGITEFVVGTGGESHLNFTVAAANLAVFNNTTYGVLKLTLHPYSYSWQFVPDGKSGTFTDSGSASCV